MIKQCRAACMLSILAAVVAVWNGTMALWEKFRKWCDSLAGKLNDSVDKYRDMWNESMDDKIAAYSKDLEDIGPKITAEFIEEGLERALLDDDYERMKLDISEKAVARRKKLYAKQDRIVKKWCEADAAKLKD